jgi:hypothetical protein
MKKLTDIAGVYFRRRRYFRLFLIFLILAFWAYIEISELFPPAEHDLNYHAREEINSRYNGGPFTFAVLGDSKNSPVFSHVVQALNSDKNLDFVVMGGDLVLHPTQETYKAFLNQWRDLQIPMLTLPGNHDVAFENSYFYYSIFGRFYYSFVLGDAKFILLDDSDETSLGDEQLYWLKKELADGLQYRYRFVFLHVPLWDPRDSGKADIHYAHSLKDPDAARQIEDLMLNYKVTIVFASHIHAYYNYTPRGLHTIITGGAGAELVGKDPEHRFYHYVKISVSGRGVQTETIKINLDTPTAGLKKYFNLASLYTLTLGKIYFKYIILGLFVLVLTVDAFLEFLFRKKQRSNGTSPPPRQTASQPTGGLRTIKLTGLSPS